jgi:hypothetical protein
MLAECKDFFYRVFIQRGVMMDLRNLKPHVYVRRLNRQSRQELTQKAIIIAFFIVSVLISIFLPFYLALMSLNGG